MNYIEQIFERANLQQINGFLSGRGVSKNSGKTYAERDEYAFDALHKALEKIISDESKDFDDVLSAVEAYTNELNDIYMEIGLRCGFIIASQLYIG